MIQANNSIMITQKTKHVSANPDISLIALGLSDTWFRMIRAAYHWCRAASHWCRVASHWCRAAGY